MILERNPNSHKGDNGKVLIIGGSERYTGAPALSALAALRIGSDLAYVAAPGRAADIIASFSPDLITIKLEGAHLNRTHLTEIDLHLNKADVVVIGPGLGVDPETIDAVISIIKKCNKPMVIDADGLKAIKDSLDLIWDKQVVLTPHREEFELISGTKATAENARKFAGENAKETNIVILLKGPIDIITNGDKIGKNSTGNPGMTVGGTGDVLSGIVAGLISQGLSLFDAAYYAAKINGTAGDLCKDRYEYGFTATDVIQKIPDALKNI